MGLAFIAAALILFDVTARGTEHQFAQQLKADFATKEFIAWVAAILILGAIGYAKPARPISNALLLLVIVSMVLANRGGVFAQISNVVTNPPAPSQPVALSSYTLPPLLSSTLGTGSTSGGGGSSPGGIGWLGAAVDAFSSIF